MQNYKLTTFRKTYVMFTEKKKNAFQKSLKKISKKIPILKFQESVIRSINESKMLIRKKKVGR